MCRSNQYCKACQGPHHTLLHVEPTVGIPNQSKQINSSQNVQSYTVSELNNSTLLMTCRVLVHSRSGPSVEAQAVLDSTSSASFVSERLAQTLCLPRSHPASSISGIVNLAYKL